jgi:hypothetical protein
MDLVGRASECALLDGLIRDVRRGESRCLVLRGEAGIGKTALLEYLTATAPDLTVLRAAGVESEMELAYAGLHQLCGPLLHRLGSLPGPQRQALEIVFGMSAGAAPDRFLVALAVLSLLSEVSEVRRRRRAVAGPDLGTDARARRPPPAGRAGGAGLRGPRTRPRAPGTARA